MKKIIFLFANILVASELKEGWNLLGATKNIYASIFNRDNIKIVWKYDGN